MYRPIILAIIKYYVFSNRNGKKLSTILVNPGIALQTPVIQNQVLNSIVPHQHNWCNQQ